MPVVHVEGLPQQEGVDIAAALAAVCAELAALLRERPRGTWATWRTLERYVEGDRTATVQPPATHPPLVRLVAFEGRPPEQVAEMLDCVAGTLARELKLEPGNVFVVYEEARGGRLHTGGAVTWQVP